MSIFTKQLMAFNISTKRVPLQAHLVVSKSDNDDSTDAVRLSNASSSAVHRRALNQGWMDLARVSIDKNSQNEDVCVDNWLNIEAIQDFFRLP